MKMKEIERLMSKSLPESVSQVALSQLIQWVRELESSLDRIHIRLMGHPDPLVRQCLLDAENTLKNYRDSK